MRLFYFLTILVLTTTLAGCNGFQKGADFSEKIVGNWLIAYPKHTLKTQRQREVYGRYQDSLVTLYGLKLISFEANGWFRDIDNGNTLAGSWKLKGDSSVSIAAAGKGFDPFTATIRRIGRGQMLLVQHLPFEGERIKVTWYLRQIDESHAGAPLFAPALNSWRIKPGASESVSELKKRLANMLHFYGTYFEAISGEANYFSPDRVALPFKYYQHGLGLSGVIKPAFRELFYDAANAHTAYELLETTIGSLSKQYPSAKTYTAEYGAFMKLMAAKLKE